MGPALYTIALGTAFLSTGLSLAICAVVPFLYILPGQVDTLWKTGRQTAPGKDLGGHTEDRA